MEQLPEQVLKSQELQRKEHATALIVTLTNADQAREIERGLTINKVVDSGVPVSEIVRETGFKSVARVVDIHLTRCVAQFNRNNNLNDAQIKTLVEDLIDKYPAESIEDFILCFKMARQEEFEVPMWLDSSVIFGWMRQYLDRKYQVLEEKLKKERAEKEGKNLKRDGAAPINDFVSTTLTQWRKDVENLPSPRRMHQMTDAEIRKNGQIQPPKKVALTAGWTTYELGGYKVEAMDRKQAKKIMRIFIRNGSVPFHMSRGKSRRK